MDDRALVAACDMLVLRALELVGKRLVRSPQVGAGYDGGRELRRSEGRMRHRKMAEEGRPWHEAHLLWRPDAHTVGQGLEHAWETVGWVVDEYGCCGLTVPELQSILDGYVRALLEAQRGHATEDLRWRLAAYVGVSA